MKVKGSVVSIFIKDTDVYTLQTKEGYSTKTFNFWFVKPKDLLQQFIKSAVIFR